MGTMQWQVRCWTESIFPSNFLFHFIAFFPSSTQVDLPGFGLSPKMNPAPGPEIVLEKIISAFELIRPVIVTPSMSGRFSLALLMANPGKLRLCTAKTCDKWARFKLNIFVFVFCRLLLQVRDNRTYNPQTPTAQASIRRRETCFQQPRRLRRLGRLGVGRYRSMHIVIFLSISLP